MGLIGAIRGDYAFMALARPIFNLMTCGLVVKMKSRIKSGGNLCWCGWVLHPGSPRTRVIVAWLVGLIVLSHPQWAHSYTGDIRIELATKLFMWLVSICTAAPAFQCHFLGSSQQLCLSERQIGHRLCWSTPLHPLFPPMTSLKTWNSLPNFS